MRQKGMKNRSTIDIASDVLKAANGGASNTKIMYGALISYQQMKDYVIFLTERGLLVIDNYCQCGGAQTFRTTEKGLRFLEIYNLLDGLTKENEEEEQLAPRLQQLQMGYREKKEEHGAQVNRILMTIC